MLWKNSIGLISILFEISLFILNVQCYYIIEQSNNFRSKDSSGSTIQPLERRTSQDFDYYVFTQTWPISTCISYDDRQCTIPKNVTTWIVHGLWPNTRSGDNPAYCDNSYPFNANEIVPLWSVLAKYWTNLFTDSAVDSFWTHEWEKHGTCAKAGTDYIKSEFDYFSYTLDMYLQYPVADWLNSAGILPSDTKGLNFTDVYNVITNNTGGKQVTLQCKYNDVDGTHFIDAIEICLDKFANPVDCQGSSDQGCPKNDPFLYPQTVKVFENRKKASQHEALLVEPKSD